MMRKSLKYAFIASVAAIAFFRPMDDAKAQSGSVLGDGTTVAGHLLGGNVPAGGPPALTGCTAAAGSTDMIGGCTASASSGSLTFNKAFVKAPFCLVVDASATSTVSMPVYTVSITAITLTTIISGHLLQWLCIGQVGN